MKKIRLPLLIVVLVGLVYLKFFPSAENTRALIGKNVIQPFMSLCIFQSTEKPLENCHPTCQLNHGVLKNKIAKGLPPWAKEQINEDMAHLNTMKNFNFHEILKRYGVVNNVINLVLINIHHKKIEIILPEMPNVLPKETQQEIINLAKRQYQPIADVLTYLVRQNHLKDTTFLLAINDFALLNTEEPLPIFTYAKDTASPSEAKLLLLPDWMNFCSSTSLRSRISLANAEHPWKNKKNIVFWRGGVNDSTHFRHKLVSFSEKNPDAVDAHFVPSKGYAMVKPEDHLDFKYLISVDGMRCAWERLIWLLHSNSLTFKHESTQMQWYYKAIKPYVHYLPVTDEASILTQMAWAEANPKEVADIIERSTTFVEQNLKLEDFYHYLIVLMQQYTEQIYNKL